MNTIFSGRQLPSLAVDEIRLADALTLLVEGKKLILSLTAAMTLLGLGYAFLAPPVFRADALVQVADSTGIGNDGLAAVASMFDNKATDDAEMELIGSRLVVGSTVRDLHLDIEVKPKYFPVIGRILASYADPKTVASAEFGLTSYAWGGERIAVSRLDVPRRLFNKKFFLIADGEQTVSLMDDSGKKILKGQVGQQLSGDTEYGRVYLFVQAVYLKAFLHE
jgi:tyrosine-protein kinase Etk/Wzc